MMKWIIGWGSLAIVSGVVAVGRLGGEVIADIAIPVFLISIAACAILLVMGMTGSAPRP
jgi:hypothetical protein